MLLVVGCPLGLQAQGRYSMTERWENRLANLSEFTTKDVENKTDVLFGLHASQYTGSHHLLGFSAEGAWSAAINNMPRVSALPGGANTGLRLVYEYQYSGLLIQTGVGIGYQCASNFIGDTLIIHEHMHDVWNGQDVEYTLKHNFYDRTDHYQQLYAQIPLYIGHYILGARGIGYFLTGVHVNYSFWGSTRQKLTGTTTGIYERYVGVWEEMDNHGFRKDVPIERTDEKLQIKLDLMVHGEIGYEYTTFQNPKSYRVRPGDRLDCRLRFAAYADFGILDVSPNTKKTFYETPMETIFDFPSYQFHHAFSTTDAQGYWMRHLNVGVRFTVLFGFQGKERCILCDPWRH